MAKNRFGDICKVLNGRAYKQNELLASGKYPIFVLETSFQVTDGIIRIWNYPKINTAIMKICFLRGQLLSAQRFGTEKK